MQKLWFTANLLDDILQQSYPAIYTVIAGLNLVSTLDCFHTMKPGSHMLPSDCWFSIQVPANDSYNARKEYKKSLS
jgi:hypothetical protein